MSCYRMFDLLFRAAHEKEVTCPMCHAPLSIKDLDDEYQIEDYLNGKWIDPNKDLLNVVESAGGSQRQSFDEGNVSSSENH